MEKRMTPSQPDHNHHPHGGPQPSSEASPPAGQPDAHRGHHPAPAVPAGHTHAGHGPAKAPLEREAAEHAVHGRSVAPEAETDSHAPHPAEDHAAMGHGSSTGAGAHAGHG